MRRGARRSRPPDTDGPDVDGDQEGAESHHGQKEAQLVAAERLVYLAAEQQEVEGKVDGEDQHEERDDDLNGRLS